MFVPFVDLERERAERGRLELELDDLELELGLDRDLGLPLRGAPGGDDGLLDPMSLPGAADDLDGLLEGDLDGLLEGDLDSLSRRVRPRVRCAIGLEGLTISFTNYQEKNVMYQ